MRARRQELYRELDTYLSERRMKEPQQPRKRPAPKEEPPMESHPAEEYEQTRESWWSKFKKSFSSPKSTEEPSEEHEMNQMPTLGPSQDEVMNDMKEVARIALIVLRKMNAEQTREFKETPDYEQFKIILRKHGMIK